MAWVGSRESLAATIILVLAAGAATSAATSGAETPTADSVILAGPGSTQSNYATPSAVAAPEGGLVFHNLDLPKHNVVAHHAHGADDNPWCDGYDPGECPAFWSPLIGLGSSTPVMGIDQLDSGTYAFYCTAHPWMEGVLVVTPNGVETSQTQADLTPDPMQEDLA